MATKFSGFTQESSPALTDQSVGYRTAVTGGERRFLWSAIYALFKTSYDAAYAALSHTHAQSEVTDLTTDLAAKAALSHSHVEGDVTGLTAALAAKAAIADVLETDNTDAFTPTADYHPATKKYIDDQVIAVGSGDVVGPAGATDEQIPVFDGATGKLVKDGGSTIANVLARGNHTGTQDADTITDGSTNKAYTGTEQTKLATIETSATADQSNSEIETAYNAQVSTVSQAEAEAGSATTIRTWTAQRVAQAIAALGASGNYVSVPVNQDSAGVVGQRARDGFYEYRHNGTAWARWSIETTFTS